jgi:hypothetical protein
MPDTNLEEDHPRIISAKNFDEIVIGWFSSKNVSGGSALLSRWPPQPNLALHRTLWEIHIKIFSSETTGPITIQWLFYQSLVPIEQLKGSRQEDFYVNFP